MHMETFNLGVWELIVFVRVRHADDRHLPRCARNADINSIGHGSPSTAAAAACTMACSDASSSCKPGGQCQVSGLGSGDRTPAQLPSRLPRQLLLMKFKRVHLEASMLKQATCTTHAISEADCLPAFKQNTQRCRPLPKKSLSTILDRSRRTRPSGAGMRCHTHY